MTGMSKSDNAGSGVNVGREAIRAKATGDNARLLDVINRASRDELTWAVCYLTATTWEATMVAAGEDIATARQALLHATDSDEDSVIAQLEVIVRDAAQGLT